MIPFAAYSAAETPCAFQWARQLQKLPISLGWGILTPILYTVHWPTRVSLPPNGISICSAVFVQYVSVTNTQTDRHTLHVTSVAIHAMRPKNQSTARSRKMKADVPVLA